MGLKGRNLDDISSINLWGEYLHTMRLILLKMQGFKGISMGKKKLALNCSDAENLNSLICKEILKVSDLLLDSL